MTFIKSFLYSYSSRIFPWWEPRSETRQSNVGSVSFFPHMVFEAFWTLLVQLMDHLSPALWGSTNRSTCKNQNTYQSIRCFVTNQCAEFWPETQSLAGIKQNGLSFMFFLSTSQVNKLQISVFIPLKLAQISSFFSDFFNPFRSSAQQKCTRIKSLSFCSL